MYGPFRHCWASGSRPMVSGQTMSTQQWPGTFGSSFPFPAVSIHSEHLLVLPNGQSDGSIVHQTPRVLSGTLQSHSHPPHSSYDTVPVRSPECFGGCLSQFKEPSVEWCLHKKLCSLTASDGCPNIDQLAALEQMVAHPPISTTSIFHTTVSVSTLAAVLWQSSTYCPLLGGLAVMQSATAVVHLPSPIQQDMTHEQSDS